MIFMFCALLFIAVGGGLYVFTMAHMMRNILRSIMIIKIIVYTYIDGLPLVQQGGDQNFSCDPSLSKPLCPGTIARCTCVVRGTSYTKWNFTNKTVCSDNFIRLAQICTDGMDNGTCGPYLNASNTDPGDGYCNTSVLVITANENLNGLVIECLDLNRTTTSQLVGNISVLVTNVTGIPGTPMVDVSAESDKITVTWTPPNTGGVPSSYNVSISDGSIPVVIPDNGSALYTHTFAGLTNDTLYTISVVAINCLGSKIASKTIQTSPAVLPASSENLALLAATPTGIIITPTVLPASSENLPLLAATPTGIIIAALVILIIIVAILCIIKKKQKTEYNCQEQKVSCLRRVFCDGDDTPDATPDSVKTHKLNTTPAICASTSFTTRDAKATPPTDTTNQAPTIQETSPNAPSCTTGYCFKSSRVEEDGDDTLNTAPESTELHILNTTPAVRANTSSSTGYMKAISEAHRGDMRNKNGRVDTDGDDTHITTPHKYASIKPQIGGKRSKNADRRVETDSPDEIGVVPTHPYNLRQRILRNEVQ